MRNYDEVSVIASLMRKSTINIDRGNKTINILVDSTELGNTSWGKIDFLVNHCRYHVCYVSNLGKKNRKQITDEDIDISSKLDIVGAVKLKMRK